MKKVIDGKTYNTETAKELGVGWNGKLKGDAYSIVETLYVKKDGEYFLFIEGGALTKYGREARKGNRIAGCAFQPFFDESDAKRWAEKNLTVDEYETIWGPVKEDDETPQDRIDRLTKEKKEIENQLYEIEKNLNEEGFDKLEKLQQFSNKCIER